VIIAKRAAIRATQSPKSHFWRVASERPSDKFIFRKEFATVRTSPSKKSDDTTLRLICVFIESEICEFYHRFWKPVGFEFRVQFNEVTESIKIRRAGELNFGGKKKKRGKRGKFKMRAKRRVIVAFNCTKSDVGKGFGSVQKINRNGF
jgi:hypothetical protein